MTARKQRPAELTAGQRLIAELGEDKDPYSLTFLIEQAAIAADYLEKLNELLRGDRDAWVQVKIGAKTVEVIVTDVLRQHRQTSEQLRKLLITIRSQRATLPTGPKRDDDLTGLT